MTGKLIGLIIFIASGYHGYPGIDSMDTEIFYDKRDVDIITHLGNLLSCRYYIFVHDKRATGIVDAFKTISHGRRLFFSVLTRNNLFDVFTNENLLKTFLQAKIAVITKEYMNFTEVFQNAPFPESMVWMIFCRSFEELSDFNIPPNVNLLGIETLSDRYVVKRLYKLHPQDEMIFENFGIWFQDRFPNFLSKSNSSRLDFRNTSLKILMHEKMNDEDCILTQNLVLFKMRCFHTELIEILSRTLNFNLNDTKYLDINFPYFNENGSSSEVFLSLQNKEIDLSGCTYTVSNQRRLLYDFAWPTFSLRSMLYVKNEPGKRLLKAFLKPINFKIYCVILAWIVASGLITQLFRSVRAKSFRIKFSSAIKSMLMFFQVFCNQSCPRLSHWCSDRIIHMMTLLFVIIIYQNYCAKLISSITIMAPEIPFFTFDDFVRDGSYRLMTLMKGFHQIVFIRFVQNLKLDHLMMDAPDLPVNPPEALSKLCKNDRLTYVEFRENVAQHDFPCDIIEIPRPIFYYYMGLGLPKNSPYSRFMNQEITRFYSIGIINRMKRHMFSNKKLKQHEVEGFVSVTLRQVSFAFIVLIIGITLSLMVLAIEMYYKGRFPNRYCKRKMKTFTLFSRAVRWTSKIKQKGSNFFRPRFQQEPEYDFSL